MTGPSQGQPIQGICKIAIGGDATVGKTTLIRKYSSGKFEQSRVSTIGVDITTQPVVIGDRRIKLTIWDLAGQNRYAFMRATFYRGSRTVIIVFDVTNEKSFNSIPRWFNELRSIMPTVPVFLLGNKVDLPRIIPLAQGQALANHLQAGYFETSCLTGQGVEELFNAVARQSSEFGG